MGDKTGISWTDATWSPVRGCSRISEGCRNCYAEKIAARFSKPGQPFHGFAQVTAPRDLLDRVGARRNGWTRKVELQPDQLTIPLKWRKPRRIFTSSMTDIFHEKLSNEEIAAIFGVMAACPQHTFQVLTKRAKRMREWFEWRDNCVVDPILGHNGEIYDPRALRCWDAAETALPLLRSSAWSSEFMDLAHLVPWPLPNVWIGTSVENQDAANERIPNLLRTPAVIRFLSCEPLIGPVELRNIDAEKAGHDGMWFVDALTGRHDDMGRPCATLPGIDWVIVGCESGPGARLCDIKWIRSLRDQCASAGVKLFLKQAEESADLNRDRLLDIGDDDSMAFDTGSKLKARRPGGNHIIELPYLDGVQHANFPEVAT